MSTPLVSVVVTCYNYGRYLHGCLDSVIAQTWPNLEIIVVDDGSTDKTEEVIRRYLMLPNLKYIRQENSGQARAKNVGIRNSSGEFVAFLDADDVWCADKLEKQMRLFRRKETGVVYSRARYLDEKSEPLEYEMTAAYLQPRRGSVTRWLFFDNFVQFSSSVVRRECFDRFGLFDESLRMGIDWDLWLRLSTAYEFDYVDERLFYYRIGHAGQMSHNLEERQRCSDRTMKRFLEQYPGRLSPRSVRQAYAYCFCNRGYYYRYLDTSKSTQYFMDSVFKNPIQVAAYRGLVVNCLSLSVRLVKNLAN